ncbi:peptidoglycan DD-metalloendopeptidase family protein [Enterococcus sp. DIV0876]|uniref:M23 family metallopeptidase n=1 Tax=Enterococcus sp. DIV0876 TaxID=2774633 RepID=UPI003D3014C1
MKHTRKWLAIALVCSQLLTSLPVSAAVVANESTESSTEETTQSAEATVVEEAPTIEEQPAEEIPEAPETPAIPEETTPDVPEVPEEPESPVTPEVPEAPETPETPEESTPEEPEVPESPETPAKPDTPATEKPETSIPSVPEKKPTQPETTAPGNNTSSGSQSSNNSTTTVTEATPLQVTPTKETWAFIQEIGEEAREIGLEEDLYASVMIAQAILESANGQSQLSQAPYFNLFGIKGTFEGQGVNFRTQEEDTAGNYFTITATFRQYNEYAESLQDYADLLKNGLDHNEEFYKGAWKSETEDYEEATAYLTGRYATDSQYDQKLNALIEAYALTSYDHELPEGSEMMLYPVKDPQVSSSFGPRGSGFHRGVDFAAPLGTPIYASQAGTVIRAESHYSWGNYVAILHDNGLTTLYAHNNQNLVKVGQRVAQGEVIASMGSTGNSTGPHLHFEVSLSPSLAQDQLVDPMTVLNK